jgi:hemoglobin/transferrin/lactoferrin receptor protein
MTKKKLIILFYFIFCFNSKAEITLDTIYITTNKLKIIDDTASSSEVSEGEITQNPSRSIPNITKTLPNVESAGGPRGSSAEFRIRGMEDTRITTKIDGSKSTFRGEYKGRNFVLPFLLRDISVIRGSSSVMDGSGAIAGGVYLRTKEVEDIALNPNTTKGVELFSSYGTNGNMQNYGGAGFARKDGYSILGMYSYSKNDDFKFPKVINVSSTSKTSYTDNIDYSANEVNNGLVKLKKDFNENEFIKVSAGVFTEDGITTTNPFRLYLSSRGDPASKKLINYRTNGELELENLNITAFYENTKIDELRFETNTLPERADQTKSQSYGFNSYGKYKYKNEQLENILFYGGEIIREDQSSKRDNSDGRGLFPKGNTLNQGLFAENMLKFGSFKTALGLRQDFYQINSGEDSIKGSSKFLKKASLSYDVGGVFTPFIRYTEGYRSPLLKETFAEGGIAVTNFVNLNLIKNKDLKPEYSKNYEAGFKLLREGLFEDLSETSLNFTYFIQDIKNYTSYELYCKSDYTTCYGNRPTYSIQYQNLDKVRFNGIEVEAKYNSNKYLFSVGVSTLKAKEIKNNNNLLQIPPAKLVIKAERKFQNDISIGVENISVASSKNNARKYYNFIQNVGCTSGTPLNNCQPNVQQMVLNYDNSEQFKLSEETAGYNITNFNISYTKKTPTFEGLFGITLENAFNIEYKEQTSFITGLGRNINFYFKVKL